MEGTYEGGSILGIDYAMHGMAVFSDEMEETNPGYLRQAEGKLAREQRRLSHCQKGSSNYRKQKKKVALCHEKVKNQRKDYIHKLTRRIADSYDAVAWKGEKGTEAIGANIPVRVWKCYGPGQKCGLEYP